MGSLRFGDADEWLKGQSRNKLNSLSDWGTSRWKNRMEGQAEQHVSYKTAT